LELSKRVKIATMGWAGLRSVPPGGATPLELMQMYGLRSA
jgi:hypothetical protein